METSGYYTVSYVINGEGKIETKMFDSPYFARNFIDSIKRSKHYTLLSYPYIDD